MTQPPRPLTVLYVRVSTDRQSVENQLPALRRLARARGLKIGHVFRDVASGVGLRASLGLLLESARAGRIGTVLVWSIDRLGRHMPEIVSTVNELARLGVRLLSVSEPWLDVPAEVRPLLVSIFAWVAGFERAHLVRKTRAGLERARREGTRLGRRPHGFDVDRARELAAEGMSLRQIAQRVHAPRATIARRLKARRA